MMLIGDRPLSYLSYRDIALMTQPYSEKRRAPRKRTLKGASIALNDRQSVITCTMRNLSASGALLILPSMQRAPAGYGLESAALRVCMTKLARACPKAASLR